MSRRQAHGPEAVTQGVVLKVTYNWLKDYVDFPAEWGAKALAEKLTNAGLEVERVEELPGGDWLFDCEVTTNRPDWLGAVGIAREIAALAGTEAKYPEALEVLNHYNDEEIQKMGTYWACRMLRAYGQVYLATGREAEAMAKFKAALELENKKGE